mmetsp:Transcript_1817/g.4768  ORF Transcript_1817/g.4768 Transcript_1817/m.4768 type:complete len:129 (-) Transcript_1817:873-1259(-)
MDSARASLSLAEDEAARARIECYQGVRGAQHRLERAQQRLAHAQEHAEELAAYRFGSREAARHVLKVVKRGGTIDRKAARSEEPLIFSHTFLRSLNGLLLFNTVVMLSLLPEHAATASSDALLSFPLI